MRAVFVIVAIGGYLVFAFAEGTRAEECSKNDIAVTQGTLGRLPTGIPIFGVEITNTCAKGYPIADVHLSCGEFTSATLINPMIFRRLAINDCLVNNGAPLLPGYSLSFRYATNFMYDLSVSSAAVNKSHMSTGFWVL